MSRTNRRSGGNSPVKHYLEYKPSLGTFSYYDKTAKERVYLESLDVILIDERASVSGYHAPSRGQISSNMVLNTKKEPMTVVAWKDKKKTEIAEGFYSDIKTKVGKVGGKYTRNVFVLADVAGDGLELCNLQLNGSAARRWGDFIKKVNKYDSLITITKGVLSKKDGDDSVPVTPEEEKALDAKIKKNPRTPRPIWFYLLSLEANELSDEDAEQADTADEVLKVYLGKLPSSTSSDDDSVDDDDDDDAPTPPDDDEAEDKEKLPF